MKKEEGQRRDTEFFTVQMAKCASSPHTKWNRSNIQNIPNVCSNARGYRTKGQQHPNLGKFF